MNNTILDALVKQSQDRFVENSQYGILGIAIPIILGLCVLAIGISVLNSFLENQNRDTKVKKESKNIVETGTMTGFFVAFYLVLNFRIFALNHEGNLFNAVLIWICLGVCVFSTYVNVASRTLLAGNWGNQIRIYKDHTIIEKGAFKYVRHPLYASLIWLSIAISIMFLNYGALLLTLIVFVPAMYYRAKKEEEMLIEEFGEKYHEYKNRTGMFLPKLKI